MIAIGGPMDGADILCDEPMHAVTEIAGRKVGKTWYFLREFRRGQVVMPGPPDASAYVHESLTKKAAGVIMEKRGLL